jgi:hypothetical protein
LFLLIPVPSLLMVRGPQANPRACPFKKKASPLFDNVAEICRDVIATSASAFRATEDGKSSGKGSDGVGGSDDDEKDGDGEDEDEPEVKSRW